MARTSAEVANWLSNQILETQIGWMECQEAGNTDLLSKYEAVLDGIYAFRQFYLGVAPPAPGQGYQPPQAEWKNHLRQQKLEDIDGKISALVAKREAILTDQS